MSGVGGVVCGGVCGVEVHCEEEGCCVMWGESGEGKNPESLM